MSIPISGMLCTGWSYIWPFSTYSSYCAIIQEATLRTQTVTRQITTSTVCYLNDTRALSQPVSHIYIYSLPKQIFILSEPTRPTHVYAFVRSKFFKFIIHMILKLSTQGSVSLSTCAADLNIKHKHVCLIYRVLNIKGKTHMSYLLTNVK